MVVKHTARPLTPTRATAAADAPADRLRQRFDEIIAGLHAAPVTPQRFLEFENALHEVAQDTCRRVVEQEANRLEADDRQKLPSKVRQGRESYRLNKQT